METKNIMIVGVGGQGTLLTSRIRIGRSSDGVWRRTNGKGYIDSGNRIIL